MNREDFNVIANARGYQVYYKGPAIGGAGISNGAKIPTGRRANKQIHEYSRHGNIDIDNLLSGNGRPDMLEAIQQIDKDELIGQVAEWVDTHVIAELIVDHLQDQGDELSLENAKECWYAELEHLGARMATSEDWRMWKASQQKEATSEDSDIGRIAEIRRTATS